MSAREMARDDLPRLVTIVLRAWRGITFRQWAWTTAVALLLLLANVAGQLPGILSAVPYVIGSQRGWKVGQFVGQTVFFLAAAYCFLLAVSIAEYGTWHRLPPVRRYVAAGFAASAAAILIQATLYALAPSLGWNPVLETQQLPGGVAWSAANLALSGGLPLAVYVYFRSARFAREAFNAAELERLAASREVLASRLAAMQAQVEPGFLLGTLAQVEALYEREPQAGDRMLDGLIAYLHAALPQLRGQRSTLEQEMNLAESYLRIVQIRMGSRLDYRFNVGPGLGVCDFPPMVLLPLIDDALRNGLEPLPHGGTIIVAADAVGDRVRVAVMHDGVIPPAPPDQNQLLATLRERLEGLYGPAARLTSSSYLTQGVQVAIEVPNEAARHHR